MLVPLALGLSLASGGTPSATAATIPPKVQLDAEDLRHPLLLDQNGRFVLDRNATGSGAGASAGGSVPTYVAYPVDRDDPLPQGYPTIDTGPRVPGRTVGLLNLSSVTRGTLDSTLAQNGEAVVHAGDRTALVKPATAAAAGNPSLSVWLAGQAGSGTGAGTPIATTPSQSKDLAQMLNLDGITRPITNSALMKDLNHLLAIKSGKFVNWNHQSLDALKRDLKLGAPKPTTAHPVAPGAGMMGTGTTTASSSSAGPSPAAAQMLDSSGAGTGTVLAAPVPEPSTYLIFGLAAGALVLRRRRQPG
jgi:hypothetical protein